MLTAESPLPAGGGLSVAFVNYDRRAIVNRVVFVALLLAVSGCRRNQDVQTTSEPVEQTAQTQATPATSPTSSPDEPGLSPEEEKAKWERISGVELFRRNFLVRAGDMPIGSALLTLREFQDGVLLRTGLEYWLFPRAEPDEARAAEYWFKSFCSEFADSRPVAVWGTGLWHDWGFKFRLQGEDGKLMATGNRWGGYKNPRKHIPPEGYRLLTALREHLKQAISGEGPKTFKWQRCLWREEPLAWCTYDYTYAGPESVTSAEGQEHAAHRFEITPDKEGEPAETVWVDGAGLPLRRTVPGRNNFEMLVSEKDRENDVRGIPTWPEAEKRFGREKAALTVLPANIEW